MSTDTQPDDGSGELKKSWGGGGGGGRGECEGKYEVFVKMQHKSGGGGSGLGGSGWISEVFWGVGLGRQGGCE